MNKFKVDIGFDKQSTPKNKIDTRSLVTEDYEPYDLNLTKVNTKVKIVNESLVSVNIPEVQFCNKLPSIREALAVESYIKLALDELKKETSDLVNHCSPINYGGKNKDRIKRILLEYVGDEFFHENSEYFRKSDIRTDVLIENRGAFRVISYYQIEPLQHRKQRHSKHYLNVLFLDPYHLFLPSKVGEMTAEEYKVEMYKKVSSNTDHIHKHINI